MKYDVIASGYVSLDRMIKIKTPARVGYTSLVENKTSADIYYGGCSLNISYALCRLGLRALPLLRVGSDYASTGLKAFLENNNVPTDAITVVPEDRTSVCYLVQDPEGGHITLYYPGAMSGAYMKPLNDALFEDARLGVLTVGARCDNEEFVNKCKQHNVPLIFGMKGDMDAFPEDFLLDTLRNSRIIFTNECEKQCIESIYGMPLLSLFDTGCAEIIVTTLGEQGSRVHCVRDGGIHMAELPIYRTSVVDATGAGDAYISGFLYGYLQNMPPEDCALLGASLSSFVIEQDGCCTGAPPAEDLMVRYKTLKQKA